MESNCSLPMSFCSFVHIYEMTISGFVVGELRGSAVMNLQTLFMRVEIGEQGNSAYQRTGKPREAGRTTPGTRVALRQRRFQANACREHIKIVSVWWFTTEPRRMSRYA